MNNFNKNDRVIMIDGTTHIVKDVKKNKVFIDIHEHQKNLIPLISGFPEKMFSLLDSAAKKRIDKVLSLGSVSIINKKDALMSANFKTKKGTIGTFIAEFKKDNNYNIQILAHNQKDENFEEFVRSVYALNGFEIKKLLVDSDRPKNKPSIVSIIEEESNGEEVGVKAHNHGGR